MMSNTKWQMWQTSASMSQIHSFTVTVKMQKVVKEYNQHSDAGEKLGWTVWSHTIVLQRRRGAEVGAQLVHCICRHAVLMLDWRCWMTSPFPHVVSSRCMHTRNTHICTGVHLLYLLAYLLCQEGDFTFSSSRLTSFCVSLYLPYFAPPTHLLTCFLS